MFSRRETRSFINRIKELLWPSMGWKRAGHYLALKILRLSDADGHDKLAQSVACGMAMSFFPVFGVHALMAAAMAALLRANIVIAMVATLVIPPVILPVVFSLDFLVGRQILKSLGLGHGNHPANFENTTAATDLSWLSENFHELFVPAFVGFLLFFPLVWSAGYMATHQVMAILRERYKRKHKDTPL